MKEWIRLTRRSFLKQSAIGSAMFLTAITNARPLFALNDTTKNSHSDDITEVGLDIVLTAGFDEVPILPGPGTKVLRYRADMISGQEDAVRHFKDSYLGPVIQLRRGQRVRIHFRNEIREKSIVHWHGLHVPEIMDGQPRYAVGPQASYLYDFRVLNRAGTYWYHPHPHRRTGPQAYFGLAGLLIVTDEEEDDLGLPSGAYDIPLVIQDRSFDSNNQLLYLSGGMMERMTGFHGDLILVNGKPDYTHVVSSQPYRLRLLNGSNARIYKLAWQDGSPLTVIGTDGGLLRNPVTRPYIMLGPGERVDLWADFSVFPKDTVRVLKSLPFNDGFFSSGMGGIHRSRGMMGQRMGIDVSPILPGSEYTVMRFRIEGNSRAQYTLPDTLSRFELLQKSDAVNRKRPRRFDFSMRGMAPVINGRVFEMNAVAHDEIVSLDTTEMWELSNTGSGMMGMMQMPHPVHIHGLQFLIEERVMASGYGDVWETVKDGWLDEGFKDTVLLMPGMRVKLLMKFEDHPGMFLYHCHNLEHEDTGMMRNYLIRA